MGLTPTLTDHSPTYGIVKFRVAFEIDFVLHPSSNFIEEFEKKFRTYIKQQVSSWHYLYYLPFQDDNQFWNPKGTEFGKNTNYKIKKLPVAISLKDVERLHKLCPESTVKYFESTR